MLASSDNKVIFVGHSGVGKTSIINKKQNDSFNIYQEATIGAAYTTMKISIDDDTEVSFGVWDTAGQERYDALTPLYFRGCRVAVVVFDLSKKDSFKRANYWMKKIEEKYKDYLEGYILVGSKCDKKNAREVTVDEAHKLAEKFGTHYYEVSALTGECISDLFMQVALIIFNVPPVFDDINIRIDDKKLFSSPKPGRENCYGYVRDPRTTCGC
jgi:Ras-related protein Rab-5C